jgi:hypothetical protein
MRFHYIFYLNPRQHKIAFIYLHPIDEEFLVNQAHFAIALTNLFPCPRGALGAESLPLDFFFRFTKKQY